MASFSTYSLVSLFAITSIFSYSFAGGILEILQHLDKAVVKVKPTVDSFGQEFKEGVGNVVHGTTQTQQVHQVAQDSITVPASLHEAIEDGAYHVGRYLARKHFGPGGEKGFRWGVRAKKLYVAAEGLCAKLLNRNDRSTVCSINDVTINSLQYCSKTLCSAQIGLIIRQNIGTIDYIVCSKDACPPPEEEEASWCKLDQGTSLDPICDLKNWYRV